MSLFLPITHPPIEKPPALIRASDLKGIPSVEEVLGGAAMGTFPFPIKPPPVTGGLSNFATFDPANKSGNCVLSNGNKTESFTSISSNGCVLGTIGLASGKYYCEFTLDVYDNANGGFGICVSGKSTASSPGNGASTDYAFYPATGTSNKVNNGSYVGYGGSGATVGTVFMMAFDITGGKLYFGRGGTWLASSDPATDTSPAYSGIAAGTYYLVAGHDAGSSRSSGFTLNAGASAFTYGVPSGYTAGWGT